MLGPVGDESPCTFSTRVGLPLGQPWNVDMSQTKSGAALSSRNSPMASHCSCAIWQCRQSMPSLVALLVQGNLIEGHVGAALAGRRRW